MAEMMVHNELKNWNSLHNFIEFYKFKIGHTFPLLYWSIGILSTIVLGIIINQSEKIINSLGLGSWIVITIFFTILLVWSISLINSVHKTSAENLEYLYRKLDKQNV